MKHYKEGRNHVIEFGEISIKRIILNKREYEELANYFIQQQVKNLNIPAVSNNEVAVCDSPNKCPFQFRSHKPICSSNEKCEHKQTDC